MRMFTGRLEVSDEPSWCVNRTLFFRRPGDRFTALRGHAQEPSRTGSLVAEMSHPREDHRHIMIVHRLDDFLITNRPARLDDRRNPGLRGGIDPVPEGKKRIGS